MPVCVSCGSYRPDPTSETQQMALLTQMLREDYHPQRTSASSTSDNLPQISHLLQQAQSELQRYDSEILSLNIQRAEILRRISGYESLLSPIRKLPDDVLREIFLHICTENIIGIIGKRREVRIPGLILGQVCSRWRESAVSTRRLWSCFKVSLSSLGQKESFSSTALTKMLLERSGNTPLWVNMNEYGLSVAEVPSLPVLDLVARNAQRLEHLELNVFTHTLNCPLLSSIKGNLPLLRSLDILFMDNPPYSNVIDIFQDAPLLHSVSLRYDKHKDIDIKFVVPWHQLKSLSCTYLQPHIFSVLSSSGRQLEKLFLNDCGDDLVTPVTMPRLRSLSFAGEAPLSSLKCPNLDTLSICYRYRLRGNTIPVPSLLTFLDTASNIISLHLTNVLIPQEFLSSILRAFRRLESLTYLGYVKNWLPMMEPLGMSHSTALDASTAKLLPNLKHLSISLWDNITQISAQSFVRMVTSRWVPSSNSIGVDDSVSCLQSVSLDVQCQTLDSCLLDPLRVLAHAGLKVSVKDKSGVLI